MNKSNYSNLKPIPGEEKYVEWDDEFSHYGIFGSDSGFCYASFSSKDDADEYLKPCSSRKIL